MEQRLLKEIDNIMTEALFKFSIKCLHKYMKIKPKSNYAISPYNLYEALFLVYLTSSGAIEHRLKQILYLTAVSKDDLRGTVNFDKHFANLINKASTSRDLQLETNAAVCDYNDESMCWIRKSKFPANPVPMNKIFKNGFKILGDNTIANVYKINEKIRSETENYIREQVKLSAIKKDMEIVLTTVLRFNVRKFQNSTTHQPDAQNESTDEREHKSFFCNELNTLIGEFPYKNSNISLFMLLPASRKPGTKTVNISLNISRLCALIQRLSTDEGICKLRNLLDSDMKPSIKVRSLSWPVFELEKNLKIRELLQALGVEQLLMPDAIDLDTFFAKENQSVQYGTCVHRVHVNVTEKDTFGGAMTLFTGQKCFENMKLNKVEINYPFVWLIYDKRHRNILFIGAFRKSDSINETLI